MTDNVKTICFRGERYLLFGDLETGGPIATREQYERGACSFAHLTANGNVMRFGEIIGSREDIEVSGEAQAKPDRCALVGLLTDDSWPTEGPIGRGLDMMRLRLMMELVAKTSNAEVTGRPR